MKKHNIGGGDQTACAAAKARRKRRQAKLASAVADRVKGLFLRLGAVQQELNNAQARIGEFENKAIGTSELVAIGSASGASRPLTAADHAEYARENNGDSTQGT